MARSACIFKFATSAYQNPLHDFDAKFPEWLHLFFITLWWNCLSASTRILRYFLLCLSAGIYNLQQTSRRLGQRGCGRRGDVRGREGGGDELAEHANISKRQCHCMVFNKASIDFHPLPTLPTVVVRIVLQRCRLLGSAILSTELSWLGSLGLLEVGTLLQCCTRWN